MNETAKAIEEVLLRIKALIATKKTWTTRSIARDRYRHPVDVHSERAVKFCLTGAAIKACNARRAVYIQVGEYLKASATAVYDISPISVNDRLGFEAVHRVIDKALEDVRKQ